MVPDLWLDIFRLTFPTVWSDWLSYLLYSCFTSSVVNEREKSLRFLKDRYLWLSLQLERDSQLDIDGIIEVCKSRTSEEVESLLDEASHALGLTYSAEWVLVHWGEVEEMSKHRISFGSHSCTHKIFTTLSIPEVQKEVADSLSLLQSKQINLAPVLAYPNGNYNSKQPVIGRR